MFDATSLKRDITITQSTVECPVIGCKSRVPRQRKRFQTLEEFKCPVHGIYISQSTFEYHNKLDNILWTDKQDIELLFNQICIFKRESNRIARDNSEDAVTWNVFRYLEKHSLERFLSEIAGSSVEDPEIIYWSYCPSEKNIWSELQKARFEFETNPEKGSEPDLIIRSKNALFFIEAKVNANNETTPSSNNSRVEERYTAGGDNWYSKVFNSHYREIAVANRKYELLRFWLLGSWIAYNLNVNFLLVNLVPETKEQNIETVFGKYIIPVEGTKHQERAFLRLTWEQIYKFILSTKETSLEKQTVLTYLKNKTIGYDSNHNLQKAFAIS